MFVPKQKAGYWSGSMSYNATFEDKSIVDDDESALRRGQLHLGHVTSLCSLRFHAAFKSISISDSDSIPINSRL